MKKQLHTFFSLILLLSFSWQCAAKSAIFINFKLYQKELAKTVCENKDKPKSCCQAKCHLEKELKKEENSESNLPSSIKDKAEKSELNSNLISFIFVQNIVIQKINSPYKLHMPIDAVNFVFHPPAKA